MPCATIGLAEDGARTTVLLGATWILAGPALVVAAILWRRSGLLPTIVSPRVPEPMPGPLPETLGSAADV